PADGFPNVSFGRRVPRPNRRMGPASAPDSGCRRPKPTSTGCNRALLQPVGHPTPEARSSIHGRWHAPPVCASGGDHRNDDLLELCPGGWIDDPGRVQLRERLVAVAARLVAGVIAGAGPLENRHDLVDLGCPG